MINKGYYDISNTIRTHTDCKYIVVYGMRSNGKSFSTLKFLLEEFYDNYKKGFIKAFGYLRRWSEDIRSTNMQQVFKSLQCDENGVNNIEKITHHEYNAVKYDKRQFYLVHYDSEGNIESKLDTPIGYVFSLAESERIKSTGYPDIKYIMFEEFISEGLPMVNEFNRYMSVLSTIIRNRDDVTIIMLGNTINKYNIYFSEFGFYRAKTQKPNTIDIYEYNSKDGNLKIACEYADIPNKKIKKSNVYFAFNDKNSMITQGSWQIGSYPHLPYFYLPKDIRFTYYIKFDNEVFQCEIIRVKDTSENKVIKDSVPCTNKDIYFTYIHAKSSELKYLERDLVYQQEIDPHPNIRRKITNPYDDMGRYIFSFFTQEKVFYQDNSIGNAIQSYLQWCLTK